MENRCLEMCKNQGKYRLLYERQLSKKREQYLEIMKKYNKTNKKQNKNTYGNC